MEIRTEVAGDGVAVGEVYRRAFAEEGEKVAALVDALRAAAGPDYRISLVAEDARRIVGHVMFTRGLLDAPRRLVEVQVLSPLGVLPEKQAQGVGAALVRRGLELAEEMSVPLVFLEGGPRYYARFGFVAAGRHGFRKPSLRIPDTAFQVFRLSGYEPWMTGTLVYPEAFWMHDAVGLRDTAL